MPATSVELSAGDAGGAPADTRPSGVGSSPTSQRHCGEVVNRSHTIGSAVTLDNTTFQIDHDNDLNITITGWDDIDIERWIKPANARALLAIVEAWVRNIPDTEQSK